MSAPLYRIARARRPHDDLNGGALYAVDLREWTCEPIDASVAEDWLADAARADGYGPRDLGPAEDLRGALPAHAILLNF